MSKDKTEDVKAETTVERTEDDVLAEEQAQAETDAKRIASIKKTLKAGAKLPIAGKDNGADFRSIIKEAMKKSDAFADMENMDDDDKAEHENWLQRVATLVAVIRSTIMPRINIVHEFKVLTDAKGARHFKITSRNSAIRHWAEVETLHNFATLVLCRKFGFVGEAPLFDYRSEGVMCYNTRNTDEDSDHGRMAYVTLPELALSHKGKSRSNGVSGMDERMALTGMQKMSSVELTALCGL